MTLAYFDKNIWPLNQSNIILPKQTNKFNHKRRTKLFQHSIYFILTIYIYLFQKH